MAFRRHARLPLDDCLYTLQPTIPHLTRSALQRCLQRHGISGLPDVEVDKPKRQQFKRYPIGFFHIDIAEVQTAEGKLYLFVGIDRTSKFAAARLVATADRKTPAEIFQHMPEAAPYRIHTVLLDNGTEHRLTKPNHPWTHGQVERMNLTINKATVRQFHYETPAPLRTHLVGVLAAYSFTKRLKTLNGLTPCEYICKI